MTRRAVVVVLLASFVVGVSIGGAQHAYADAGPSCAVDLSGITQPTPDPWGIGSVQLEAGGWSMSCSGLSGPVQEVDALLVDEAGNWWDVWLGGGPSVEAGSLSSGSLPSEWAARVDFALAGTWDGFTVAGDALASAVQVYDGLGGRVSYPGGSSFTFAADAGSWLSDAWASGWEQVSGFVTDPAVDVSLFALATVSLGVGVALRWLESSARYS